MPLLPLPSSSTDRYNKAPAVEVIYSIRAALPESIDIQRFMDAVKQHFPKEFAEFQEFKTVQAAVMLKQDGSADSQLRTDAAGYRCVNADKTFMAHYLLQGLTLNYLRPYAGYEQAMEQLKRHWAVYRDVVGDVPITALSMRYIDRIDIPRPETGTLDLDTYFTIVSKIPAGLSAHHCYQQYWLNDPSSDIRARVIWSSLENLPGHFSFALDTEAVLDPANIADADEAWKRFDDLHAWCTHVFDHSTTDTCKALFK